MFLKFWIGKLKLFGLILTIFLLAGCGSDENSNSTNMIYIHGYQFAYNGSTKLQNVPLKTDDKNSIVAIYEEQGENLKFRDSLLVAEKYSNGIGVNAFAQNNLEYLKGQGLTISNINKSQIGLKKKGENVYAVLVEYEIDEGLIPEIPLLYISQLFIPENNSIVMISYITESSSARSHASKMFKNIN